jgi:hypothetical protein
MGFDIVLSYSTDERYIIHPAKSSVTMIKSPKQQQQQPTRSEWALGENTVPLTEKFTHLGIDRYANTMTSDTFIEDRIQLARRTAYAMMGAGLHGTNGLNPQVSRKIYLTYVLTRMTFGLESMIVTPNQVQTLEKYHTHLTETSVPTRESGILCDISTDGHPPYGGDTGHQSTNTFWNHRLSRRLHLAPGSLETTSYKDTEVSVLVCQNSEDSGQIPTTISTLPTPASPKTTNMEEDCQEVCIKILGKQPDRRSYHQILTSIPEYQSTDYL